MPGVMTPDWWRNIDSAALFAIIRAATELHGAPRRNGFTVAGKFACIRKFADLDYVQTGRPCVVWDAGAWQYEAIMTGVSTYSPEVLVVEVEVRTPYDGDGGAMRVDVANLGLLGPDLPPLPGQLWHHAGTACTYRIQGYAWLQETASANDGAACVLYVAKNAINTNARARPLIEFMDGRFTRMEG